MSEINVTPSDGGVSASLKDFTGITVAGKTADTARLITQFGLPVVLVSVFLVIFVTGLWLVRADFLRQDENRTESHERSIKGINDTYLKIHSERREDDKERQKEARETQGKLWQEIRSLNESTKEGNKSLTEAAHAITSTAAELKKLVKAME